MKLGHYKIWPDNCCKTWSGICCKGWPKNYCKVWFKKLQKSAQQCCKESKCDQYLLWILRTVSIGYNFDWNFGLEIVAEFGREKFGREKFGREKFGREKFGWEMLQKLAEKSSAGNVAEIGRKILQKSAEKCCKNWARNVAEIGWKILQKLVGKRCKIWPRKSVAKFGWEKFGRKMLFNTIGKKIGKFEPVICLNINRSFNLL